MHMTTGTCLRYDGKEPERVCIVGSEGMLGQCLVNRFKGRIDPAFSFSRSELDITDEISVRRMLRRVQPKVVINAAAFTDVDACESQFERAMDVNAEGPANLAKACEAFECLLVHVSTDYVFDGKSEIPYTEDDDPNPLSVYGETKLLGENLVRVYNPDRHIIVRTSWLFSAHGKNFARKIFDLSKSNKQIEVVRDQIGCPTYAPDLVTTIEILMKQPERGTYHFVNAEPCSRYEFAREIVQSAGSDCKIVPVRTKCNEEAAERPEYSVLNVGKFESVSGIKTRSWRGPLRECISQWTQAKLCDTLCQEVQ